MQVWPLDRLIDECEIDIIGILDADDALMSEATEEVLKVYDGDKSAAFVYSRYAIFDETLANQETTYGVAVPENWTSMERGFISHLKTFRRRTYLRTKGYDETMLYGQDRDIVYKLEEVARPVFIDKVLYKYRTVPQSLSNDPRKREIGAVNHMLAQRQALQRRRITGLDRLMHKAIFRMDYILYSQRFGRVTKMIVLCARIFAWLLDKCLRIRSSGQLRRP